MSVRQRCVYRRIGCRLLFHWPTGKDILKILLKFKTLIFLAVLFVSLGGWILPKYYYTHTYNKPGDKTDEFPVLMWRRHPPSQANPHPNMGARPILETLGGVEEARKYNNGVSHYVPWTGPLEDMTVNNNRVVLRRLASDNGQSAFELDISNELYTVTAAYRVENDEVYPELTRISGPFVWGVAFVHTLIVAVLIAVLQVALGLGRSLSVSPHNGKKLRAYQSGKKR